MILPRIGQISLWPVLALLFMNMMHFWKHKTDAAKYVVLRHPAIKAALLLITIMAPIKFVVFYARAVM